MKESSKHIRVLVAEDSSTTRQMLVQALESDPEIVVVGQAANGLEALNQALDLDPDLITMDVLMPKMDGLEATRRIVSQSNIPILMVTALENLKEHNIAFEALSAGALDVIGKTAGNDLSWQAEFVQKVKSLARLPRQKG